jgi:Nucleotide modification associated domain 1
MSESRGFRIGDYNFESERLFNTELRHDDGPDNRFPAGHKEFCDNVWQIMDEIGNLLITKQLDYGPGNINNAHGGPINGLLVRIGDKFERLKNLVKKQQIKPQHEPIEDSFKDLANYGVIGLMIQRGVWPKE